VSELPDDSPDELKDALIGSGGGGGVFGGFSTSVGTGEVNAAQAVSLDPRQRTVLKSVLATTAAVAGPLAAVEYLKRRKNW
jgi:hypothetical protein